jgi:hypothetical protein
MMSLAARVVVAVLDRAAGSDQIRHSLYDLTARRQSIATMWGE